MYGPKAGIDLTPLTKGAMYEATDYKIVKSVSQVK